VTRYWPSLVLLAAIWGASYASAGVYAQLRVQTVAGPVLATGSMLAGGPVLLPLSLFQLPETAPSAEAVASLLALTVLGTALAQLVLFRMLRLYGSRRVSLVTYLMPGFAVFYGAALLDEPVTLAALAGLALILAGVALASGAQLLRHRTAEEPA
jgi:drug/metabolite transporter (DMT)-like permease